jgi:carbon-monoxide dehydrogenase medium subunit
MYPRAFQYHWANSQPEAVALLSELGEDAKLLAGGQSLIPLMKLRLSTPGRLVDLNFIPETSYICSKGALRFGAMTRHAEIAASADAARIPILHDCAAGIADPQVRNLGTNRRLHCRSRSYRRLGARAASHGRDLEHARP